MIYFLHIPKTAGTSVAKWLYTRVGKEEMCPSRIFDQLVNIKDSNLSQFRVFCGHFGVDLDSFLGKKIATISVLRDPALRTKSHYLHVFRDPNHPRHDHVSRQSFDTFLEDRNNWPMIENFQARYLVRSPIGFNQYIGHLDCQQF